MRAASPTLAKGRLRLKGLTLLERSVQSIEFGPEDRLIVVHRRGDGLRELNPELRAQLGSTELVWVELTEPTRGQLETALMARGVFHPAHSIAIFNCDTYFSSTALRPMLEDPSFEGVIPCAREPGDAWSFCDTRAGSLEVVRVTEKERISDWCSVGYYFFRSQRTFLELAQTYANTPTDRELYVAPLYNLYLEKNHRIAVAPVEEFLPMGSLDQVAKYWNLSEAEFARENADTQLYLNATIHIGPAWQADLAGEPNSQNRLLALDQNRAPIPHTFWGRLVQPPPADPAAGFCATLPEAFLYYCGPSTFNFQHHLTELFPKLLDYIALVQELGRPIPLLMPRFQFNRFVAELLGIMGMAPFVTFLEEEEASYRVEKLYSSSYQRNFTVHEKVLAAMSLLRSRLAEVYPDELPAGEPRRLYLGREKVADNLNNNCNSGGGRVFVNEDQVLSLLAGHGFETVLLASHSMHDKRRALSHADIIVSPIGANLMNLLFLTPPYPRMVIIIQSSRFNLSDYFIWLFSSLYGDQIRFGAIQGDSHGDHENTPFSIDASALDAMLREGLDYLAKLTPPSA